MAKSINFEPFIRLTKAIVFGSQIEKRELTAYDYACDYYGSQRVAIQKTQCRVECSEILTKEARFRSIRDGVVGTIFISSPEFIRIDSLKESTTKYLNSFYSLFIHWPTATITNENDQSIDIQDLFARIPLSCMGLTFPEYERFTFMRTTFPRVQWNHRYIHSHVQDYTSDFYFRHVCLGTGPIKNTINTLVRNPENEEAIMLFFWELDKVVHVESLTGVPYNRLSDVTRENCEKLNNITSRYENPLNNLIHSDAPAFKAFMSSFFRAENIPLAFRGGKYILGCSFMEFAVCVSNYYKRWMDAWQESMRLGIQPSVSYFNFPMKDYFIKDNCLWVEQGGAIHQRPLPTTRSTFRFGDKEFGLKIIDDFVRENYTRCRLINVAYVAGIINFILTSVNTATSTPYEEEPKKESDFWAEQYSCIIPTSRKCQAVAKRNTSTAY